MSEEDLKLLREAGLSTHQCIDGEEYIPKDQVLKLLREAPVVRGIKCGTDEWHMNNDPMTRDNSGSAFPTEHPSGTGPQQPGLTKRELFAAMAMQGQLSGNFNNESFTSVAKDAVRFADALLAELERSK